MDAMARRIHELVGWHIELYADARELDPLLPTLIALPAVATLVYFALNLVVWRSAAFVNPGSHQTEYRVMLLLVLELFGLL